MTRRASFDILPLVANSIDSFRKILKKAIETHVTEMICYQLPRSRERRRLPWGVDETLGRG